MIQRKLNANTTFYNTSEYFHNLRDFVVETILYECELSDYKTRTKTQIQNHKSNNHTRLENT